MKNRIYTLALLASLFSFTPAMDAGISDTDYIYMTGSTVFPGSLANGVNVLFYSNQKGALRFGLNTDYEWDEWTPSNLGGYSFSYGAGTIASGWYAFSAGEFTRATANFAFSYGDRSDVTGTGGTAIGLQNKVSGEWATAQGAWIENHSYLATVVGRYNVNNSGDSSSTWQGGDELFVVGNGVSSGSRSNALTVLKNGTILISRQGDVYMGEFGLPGDDAP